MAVLTGYEPAGVLKYFELLSSVPHGSGNTKAISDICVEFAKEQGLEYKQDELNNVVIFAPGTEGYEKSEPIILQGHLDMVCAKEPWLDKDMEKEPIELYVDGDFIKAKGTSLGGDNIIAVSMIMALIADKTAAHPPIEAVFTVDEEVGMDGAFGLDTSCLKGRRMINLDSEEEGVFTLGCAGGIRVNCEIPYEEEAALKDSVFEIEIGGLLGGHSGVDIDKGRASGNQLMIRLLYDAVLKFGIKLVEFEGGQFDNVITLKSNSAVAVENSKKEEFLSFIEEFDGMMKNEYHTADPGVYVKAVELDGVKAAVSKKDTENILYAMNVIPYGVQEMSMDIKGLVQTSLNMGIIKLEKDAMKFSLSVRSSIGSQKQMLVTRIESIIRHTGGKMSTHGEYPGWQYATVSPLRDICTKVFEEQYGRTPTHTATHGGLECGLFSDRLKGLDCISLGPELYDVHSVRERLGIASTKRLWDFVCSVLKECK